MVATLSAKAAESEVLPNPHHYLSGLSESQEIATQAAWVLHQLLSELGAGIQAVPETSCAERR